MQQPLRSERAMFMASDERALMKQIMATHSPDGREFDVKPILYVVEDIVSFTTPDVKAKEPFEEKSKADVTAMVEEVSYIITRISSEISYKCIGGTDGHSITLSLLNLLSSYSWDGKLMITFAAFALNYGEFWLLVQIYSSNKLANKMAILKQLSYVVENSSLLKARFDALNSLILGILDLAKCVVAFKELPSKYISPENPAFSTAMAHVPTAVYWCIRSVIACATNITYLSAMGQEYTTSTAEVWELSSLTHKVKTINDHLQTQLTVCYQHIDEKRQLEAYEALLHTFESTHLDNMKVLKSIINGKDDLLPLLDGTTKKRVNLEVLRRKTTLLLISGLDISVDEIAILELIHAEARMQATHIERQYEVVWIPVVEKGKWNEAAERQFESLRGTMPWYSVYHPSSIDPAVVKFIKDNLHFNEKAILVVLDPQGKMVSPNALHMMWIWGSNAFPFTSTREQALWREETWRLQLIVNGIDPMVLEWIREDSYIVLYGSDDIEWVKKFTTQARKIAAHIGLKMEMIYVGKSNKREVRKVSGAISKQILSHVWYDEAQVWFFWTRLECMLFSKMELGSLDEQDPVLREIKKLISYDKTGSWALFSKGPMVSLTGYGPTVLSALEAYEEWEVDARKIGFGNAVAEYYNKLHGAEHPCSRFEFEATLGRTPASMKCPECARLMEKYVTFSCCHE